MIITNKLNLPSAFVNMSNEQRDIIDKHYSCTTLLKPIREILLNRRHNNEITQDVSEMIWLLFGTAVHYILEKNDTTGYAEVSMKHTFETGYTLTGMCDLYNEKEQSLEDYKTASVWKVIFGDFKDWKNQGLIYAWLLKQLNKPVKQLKFHAIMKDWSKRDYKLAKFQSKFYPENSVWTWQYNLKDNDLVEIEEFIINKFKEIAIAEQLKDNELPLCSQEDRWNKGDTYAVMKNGRKTALRVLNSEDEAKQYMASNGGDFIETRKGEDKKCQDYCLCCEFCDYYKNNVKKENEL